MTGGYTGAPLPQRSDQVERERHRYSGAFFFDSLFLHTSKAGDRGRTGDLQLGRLTLYQLSYTRVYCLPPSNCLRGNEAGDRGRTGDLQLGKLTLCQLSYARIPPLGILLLNGARGTRTPDFCDVNAAL